MKHLIPIVLVTLALPVNALAVICKSIDADGVVSYADVPAAECPEAVKLPDYSRYSPRPIQRPPPATDNGGADAAPAFAGYTSIEIVSPEVDGTVRNNEGKVPVSIALQPALQADHKVRLFVDGEQVRGAFNGLDIELSGIERGTHQLRAEVLDIGGKSLIGTANTSFTLRKIGLLDGARPPPVNPIPRSAPGGG